MADDHMSTLPKHLRADPDTSKPARSQRTFVSDSLEWDDAWAIACSTCCALRGEPCEGETHRDRRFLFALLLSEQEDQEGTQ